MKGMARWLWTGCMWAALAGCSEPESQAVGGSDEPPRQPPAQQATARPYAAGGTDSAADPAGGTDPAGGPAPIPDFAAIADTQQKKQAFFEYMLPKVRVANDEVWAERMRLIALRDRARRGELDDAERAELMALGERYEVPADGAFSDAWFDAMLTRVDVVPAALALAQSANESAWGTSRFARQGRNFFGIWCFKPGCGIPPKRRDAGAVHEVAKFRTVVDGVRHYVHTLNTGAVYRELRAIRARLRAAGEQLRGSDLAVGLERYSARGRAYVDELVSMIRHNRLASYSRQRAGGSDQEGSDEASAAAAPAAGGAGGS